MKEQKLKGYNEKEENEKKKRMKIEWVLREKGNKMCKG